MKNVYKITGFTEKDENFNKLLNYAFFFLKFRPRSSKEIEMYLNKKIKNRHWSQDDIKKVIQHLEGLDLINDKNFVKWFVEQRILLKPKSKYALRQELLKHGIDKEIIEEYFSSNLMDEEKLAEKILHERWHRYKNLDKRKRFEKSASFLMRRGFNFEIVKKTITELSNKK